MITRWRLVLATIGAASLMMVACGDDDDDGTGGGVTATGTGTGTGSGGSGGTQTGTTTGGGGGGGEMTCETGCNALFDCGLEGDPQNCAGFAEDQRDTYLNGCDGSSGCIATCGVTPALLQFINTDDCAATVSTISGMSPDFAAACENGAGGCGGGGGGGG